MSVLWHYLQRGTTQGPISEEQLRELITSGVLSPSDQVWHEGMGGWSTIQATPELITMAPRSDLPHPPKGTPPLSTGGKKMGTGAKVAIGCGGCFSVVVLISLIGGIASPVSSNNRASTTATPEFQTSVEAPTSGILQIKARDLFRAYQKDESAADAQFKGKWVQIEGMVSDTEAVMKAIKQGKDPDNVLNLDACVPEVPDEDTLKKEAGVYRMNVERLRSLYPCIEMELSTESRRPAEGGGFDPKGSFEDLHFGFDRHREDLTKLKRGQRIQIIGRVDGFLQRSVILLECKAIY